MHHVQCRVPRGRVRREGAAGHAISQFASRRTPASHSQLAGGVSSTAIRAACSSNAALCVSGAVLAARRRTRVVCRLSYRGSIAQSTRVIGTCRSTRLAHSYIINISSLIVHCRILSWTLASTPARHAASAVPACALPRRGCAVRGSAGARAAGRARRRETSIVNRRNVPTRPESFVIRFGFDSAIRSHTSHAHRSHPLPARPVAVRGAGGRKWEKPRRGMMNRQPNVMNRTANDQHDRSDGETTEKPRARCCRLPPSCSRARARYGVPNGRRLRRPSCVWLREAGVRGRCAAY